MGTKQEEQWMRELGKVEVVKESMTSCQALTDDMMEILQTFEDKLEALVRTIQPILAETQALTTRQHNIEQTIKKVEELIKTESLSQSSPLELPSIETDYRAYLDWLKDVHKAVGYFNEHRDFRKADQALHKLKDMLEDGVKECMKEFSKRVTHDKSVGQPYRAKSLLRIDRWIQDDPTNETIDMASAMSGSRIEGSVVIQEDDEKMDNSEELLGMIDTDLIARLGSVANFLFLNGQMDFLDKLVVERSMFLSEFLQKTIEKQATNPLQHRDGKKSKTDRYIRGTHQAIFHIHLTRQLVELEARFLHLLLKEYGKLQRHLYIEHVGKILDVPIDYLVKRWNKVAKECVTTNPLIVLDMLGEYNKVQEDFFRVLNAQSNGREMPAFAKLAGLQKAMSRACSKAFIDYNLQLSKQKEKIKNFGIKTKGKTKGLPCDGTVWHGTVNCINFLLIGLNQYKEDSCLQRCIELKEFTKDQKVQNLLSAIIFTVVDTLRDTLVEVSRGYRNPSLSQIFLLNNYHFIQKRIKETKLLANDIKSSGFVEKYEKLMEEAQELYSSFSWDKALDYVSIQDSERILTKCERRGDDTLVPDRWAKAVIKSKFKEFNEKFAKQYEDQSVWSVPDADLRSQIRNRNMKKIMEAYNQFYECYRKVVFSRNMGKHIKYTPRSLKAMLESLLPD